MLPFSPNLCVIRSIKVGSTDMKADEIIENVMTALPHIIDHVPKKWKNVQSINLKTSNSIALPIFNSPLAALE